MVINIFSKKYSKDLSAKGNEYLEITNILGIKIKRHISTQKYIKTYGYKCIKEDSYKKILNIVQNFKHVSLYFDHCFGGGTSIYTREKIKELTPESLIIRVQYIQKYKHYKLSINGYCKRLEIYESNYNNLVKKLTQFNLDEIVINNIVGYPSIERVLNTIAEFKSNKTSIKITIMGHDYYPICPNFTLLDANKNCCNSDYQKENCTKCIKSINSKKLPKEIDKNYDILKYRKIWQNFTNKYVDEIRCFAPTPKSIYEKAFPESKNIITLIPHKFIPFKTAINVGIIGRMIEHKGSSIINNMLNYLEENNLHDIHFYIFGEEGALRTNSDHITILGKYHRSELPELLSKHKIDLVFIPSICHETFSYTTQEAISLNYPVICFNLGGQGDQVQAYDKGEIIPSFEPRDIYQTIKNSKKYGDYNSNEKANIFTSN